MASRIVGIDLGTTNSLCAIFANGQPKLIPNAYGNVLTPSVVAVMEDGRVIVGSPAKDYRVTHPDRCQSAFKRKMGTNESVRLGNKSFTAPELSSLVLRSLKEDAEAYFGQPGCVTEAVVTVPAYFNDHRRRATRQAGELAGLKVRRIINEPTAAALTYGFHDRNAEKKLIVIDLGGGTFDVTVMEVFDGTLEIISTAGESFLGGEDFTDRLTAAVLGGIGLQLESAEVQRPLLVARLRQECERAKCALLNEETTTIRVPNKEGDFDKTPREFRVSRAAFAKSVQSLTDRLKGPIDKALRDAHCGYEDVQDVILVGGATRMPVLVDFIRNRFEREPLSTFNPDEVVALGAAVQTALMKDDEAVADMVMTDVCPFTLGVESAKQFGSQIMDGYYTPIIHRNTTIPVSREEVFSTIYANQVEVLIKVFQGESRKVKENYKLGELRVTGIPSGPAGQPFHVRFTYDLNGILEVEALIPATGRKFAAVLVNHVQSMSDEEVREAVRRMRQIKFYPRDELRNQRLLLFAERVVGEASPLQRQSLEEAIDQFEQSMASGDRELFDASRQGLIAALALLGLTFEDEPNADSNEK